MEKWKIWQNIENLAKFGIFGPFCQEQENLTKELKNYLLLTARIPGSGIDEITPMESKLEKITPYLTVSTFKWQDIIYKGIYDEYFDEAVNTILDERRISDTLDNVEKERISLGIKQLEEDPIQEYINNNPIKSNVTGIIDSIEEKGLSISLETNVKGFIKKNNLSKDKNDQKTDRFAVGEKSNLEEQAECKNFNTNNNFKKIKEVKINDFILKKFEN